MSLSLYKRLKLLDLTSTTMIIQLAYHSNRRPVGIMDDVAVLMGKFVIPCDFIIIDMDEISQVPIIIGRPFLTIVGAVIDV